MAITMAFPCGRTLQTGEEPAGKLVRCPGCGTVLPMPLEPDEGQVDLREPAPEPSRPVTMRFGAVRPVTSAQGPEPAPAVSRSREGEWSFDPGSGPVRFEVGPDDRGSSAREYLYLMFAVAILPLAFSLLQAKDDVKDRIARTLQVGVGAVDQILRETPKEELLGALPGGRIEGALLPHDSRAHWLFAGLSAAVFLGLVLLMFPEGEARPGHLLGVACVTATAGILFLMLVQFAADQAPGMWVQGKPALVWIVLLLIGFSYRAALDPSQGFLLSVLGFTFGVGLCEELCKALPLLWIYRRSDAMTWRRACLWGLASGIGFGVSEGILYSGDRYNGLAAGGIYLVRFVSCVALHATWGASVGMALERRKWVLQGDVEPLPYLINLMKALAVPMVLHGLYDTLLKKEMNPLALGVAVVSFAWFAWQVESARQNEAAGASRAAVWA